MNGKPLNEDPSIRRRLAEEEIKLQEFYKTILTLREKETALSQGEFFDLMWVNYNNPNFNQHKQFTFFRNPGAAFSLGSSTTWVFTILAFVIAFYIYRTGKKVVRLSWADLGCE